MEYYLLPDLLCCNAIKHSAQSERLAAGEVTGCLKTTVELI